MIFSKPKNLLDFLLTAGFAWLELGVAIFKVLTFGMVYTDLPLRYMLWYTNKVYPRDKRR